MQEKLDKAQALLDAVATGLENEYQIFVVKDGGIVEVHSILDTGDGCLAAISQKVEQLMQGGHAKEQIKITKSMRPKVRVQVEF